MKVGQLWQSPDGVYFDPSLTEPVKWFVRGVSSTSFWLGTINPESRPDMYVVQAYIECLGPSAIGVFSTVAPVGETQGPVTGAGESLGWTLLADSVAGDLP